MHHSNGSLQQRPHVTYSNTGDEVLPSESSGAKHAAANKFRSKTTAEEFYAKYDPREGIQTAAILGGCLILFVLWMFVKGRLRVCSLRGGRKRARQCTEDGGISDDVKGNDVGTMSLKHNETKPIELCVLPTRSRTSHEDTARWVEELPGQGERPVTKSVGVDINKTYFFKVPSEAIHGKCPTDRKNTRAERPSHLGLKTLLPPAKQASMKSRRVTLEIRNTKRKLEVTRSYDLDYLHPCSDRVTQNTRSWPASPSSRKDAKTGSVRTLTSTSPRTRGVDNDSESSLDSRKVRIKADIHKHA